MKCSSLLRSESKPQCCTRRRRRFQLQSRTDLERQTAGTVLTEPLIVQAVFALHAAYREFGYPLARDCAVSGFEILERLYRSRLNKVSAYSPDFLSWSLPNAHDAGRELTKLTELITKRKPYLLVVKERQHEIKLSRALRDLT